MSKMKPWLVGIAMLATGALPAFAQAQYPDWWLSRHVITNRSVTNDFALLNQGQVKWIASNACDEMEARLQGGAGSAVWAKVTGFSPSNNYRVANLGQLKNVAKPFYDRLIEAQYTNAYPWSGGTPRDYAPANVGQVKNLFGFRFEATDIAGSIAYAGSQTGVFRIIAVTQATSWVAFRSVDLAAPPGAYTITNVPKYLTYWVKAWRDSDGNGTNDNLEASGECVDPATNYLTAGWTGADITLIDPGGPPASISGTVSYSGIQTGQIWIVAVTNATPWSTNHNAVVSEPGAWMISDLPSQVSYNLTAWRDSNENGSNDYWEAQGSYSNNPVYLTNDVAGIGVTLTDPDSDGDGLADYYELQLGTSPTNADTDGDLLSDYEEVVNRRTDPNNSDTNTPMAWITFPTNGYREVWLP